MAEQYKSLKKQLKSTLAEIENDFGEFLKNTDLGLFHFLKRYYKRSKNRNYT